MRPKPNVPVGPVTATVGPVTATVSPAESTVISIPLVRGPEPVTSNGGARSNPLGRRWHYLDDDIAMLDPQLDELWPPSRADAAGDHGVGAQVATALLAAGTAAPAALRGSPHRDLASSDPNRHRPCAVEMPPSGRHCKRDNRWLLAVLLHERHYGRSRVQRR